MSLSPEANMRSVVVVEDDAVPREVVRLALTGAGYEVHALEDGSQTVGLAETHDALVVVTDVFMPGCDGIEVLRDMRRRLPHAKVIAISGGSPAIGMDALATAKMLGADATLKKPFKPAEIVLLVNTLYAEAEAARRSDAAA